MLTVADDIPDDDEIVGDHPDIPVEAETKIVKPSSKAVMVK